MSIEPVSTATLALVLPLIADYQRFYGAVPDLQRNRVHFASLALDSSRGSQFCARDNDETVVGFATLYFPLSSLAARPYCLLNDLYVVPAVRGTGVGRALIKRCAAEARSRGFQTLTWQTAQTNTTAQRLYDSLPTSRSAWYTYSLPTDSLKDSFDL